MSGPASEEDDMWAMEERNKDVIRQVFAEVDRGDVEAAMTRYAPDYVDHSPTAIRRRPGGLDGLRHAFTSLQRAFPDTRHVIEDLVAEGDKVVARVSARGTHTGELFGHPPTGRVLTMSSITIYRIADGRIAERWATHGDGILEQLGILPGHEA